MHESTMVNAGLLPLPNEERRSKELPIEARHTICLEISKKRRQSVPSSIFIPKELSSGFGYMRKHQSCEENAKKDTKTRTTRDNAVSNRNYDTFKDIISRIKNTFQNNTRPKSSTNQENSEDSEQQPNQTQTQTETQANPEIYLIPKIDASIAMGARMRSAEELLRQEQQLPSLVEQQIELESDNEASYMAATPINPSTFAQPLARSLPETEAILVGLPGAENLLRNSPTVPAETDGSLEFIYPPDLFIKAEPLEEEANEEVCDFKGNINCIQSNNNNSIENNINTATEHTVNINNDDDNNHIFNTFESEHISATEEKPHLQFSAVDCSLANSVIEDRSFYSCNESNAKCDNLTAVEPLKLHQMATDNLSSSFNETVVDDKKLSSTAGSAAGSGSFSAAHINLVEQQQLLASNMPLFYSPLPLHPTPQPSSDHAADYPRSFANLLDQKFLPFPSVDQPPMMNSASSQRRSRANNSLNAKAKPKPKTTAVKKERRKRTKTVPEPKPYPTCGRKGYGETHPKATLSKSTFPTWSTHLMYGGPLGQLSSVAELPCRTEESVENSVMCKQHLQLYHQQKPATFPVAQHQQQPFFHQTAAILHPKQLYNQHEPILYQTVHQQQQQPQAVLHATVHHHQQSILLPTFQHRQQQIIQQPTYHQHQQLIIHQPASHKQHELIPPPTYQQQQIIQQPASSHLQQQTFHQVAVHHQQQSIQLPSLHQQQQPIFHSAICNQQQLIQPAFYQQQQLQHPMFIHQQPSDSINQQQSVLQPARHLQQQDKHQLQLTPCEQQFQQHQQRHQCSILQRQHFQSQCQYEIFDKFPPPCPAQFKYPTSSPLVPTLTTANRAACNNDPTNYYHQFSTIAIGCCDQHSTSFHEIKSL